MSGMAWMKRIRMIDKMKTDPVMSKKLGLKNSSYIRENKVTGHDIYRYRS